jgi:hypothetical protein
MAKKLILGKFYKNKKVQFNYVTMYDQDLIDLINSTTLLNNSDKDYLFLIFGQLTVLEKFKLKSSLAINETKSILVFLQLLKLKFPITTKAKGNSIFDKINEFISPTPVVKPVSESILTKSSEIGSSVPKPLIPKNKIFLDDLNKFDSLEQLLIISPEHLFVVNQDQAEIVLQRFLEKLDKMFDTISSMDFRRNWLATYLQSPLFISYMNTGITALKNPEIEPRNIILDTLHQANTSYLNKSQFEMASIITNHIRHLCGI